IGVHVYDMCHVFIFSFSCDVDIFHLHSFPTRRSSDLLSLIRAARAECEQVVVSLFVNPAQFGAGEDLGRYPRDEERDLRVAEEAGVDVLFVPAAEQMYPQGFATWVDVDAAGGEAAARPGHFRGVATICLKLFNL